MDLTIKKGPTECFAHHSEQEKKWDAPKVSRYLSAAVQRVSVPPAKEGNFSRLGRIQTLPFLCSGKEAATTDTIGDHYYREFLASGS